MDPAVEEITYTRRKSRGLNKDTMEDLPFEVIEHHLSEEDMVCPKCHHVLHVMSTYPFGMINFSEMYVQPLPNEPVNPKTPLQLKYRISAIKCFVVEGR